MSKIIALDIGDQWTGIAITDNSQIFVKPYTTVATAELEKLLATVIVNENIETVIVGYPKTMSGKESDQTRKVIAHKNQLESIFTNVKFILWDERLSSKRAGAIGSRKTKEDKLKSHALAAAFILDSYISFLHTQANT